MVLDDFFLYINLVNTQFMHPHIKRKMRHESSMCNTLCNFFYNYDVYILSIILEEKKKMRASSIEFE